MMPPSTSPAGEAAGAAIDMAFASLQVLTGDAGLSPALTEKFTQLIEECARHRAAADVVTSAAEGQLRAQQNQSASEQPSPTTEQAAQQNKSASAQPRPSTEPAQQGQVAEAQQSQEAEDHGRNQAAKMDEKAGQSAQPPREGEGEVQSITTTSPSPSPEKEANDTSHRNGGTAANAASLEKINSQTHPEAWGSLYSRYVNGKSSRGKDPEVRAEILQKWKT
ncbi:unnamed protein product, partial [Symbiodinium necroappetens]